MKISGFLAIILFAFSVQAQTFEREFPLGESVTVKIKNLHGRVSVVAAKSETDEQSTTENRTVKAFLSAANAKESDLKMVNESKRLEILVEPTDSKTRIDLTLKIPAHLKIEIETSDGEVRVEGDIESAQIKTDTGTIAANVPLDDLKYDFVWTESRPRFLSDAVLEEPNEKAAGKFVVNGRLGEKQKRKKITDDKNKSSEANAEMEVSETITRAEKEEKKKKEKTENRISKTNNLKITTARGIILLNVNPNEVPSNLVERPLTEAAKAIVRSGDSLLTEAIRRASPKYFGEYAKTLPPRKIFPTLTESKITQNADQSSRQKHFRQSHRHQ